MWCSDIPDTARPYVAQREGLPGGSNADLRSKLRRTTIHPVLAGRWYVVRPRMTSQRGLFIATALLEIGSGVVTAFWPGRAIELLFGTAIVQAEPLATARLYAAALTALGVACWCVRAEPPGRAVRAMICGMLTYNVGACVLLPTIAMTSNLAGVLLWPAALLHAALTCWCVFVLGSQANRGTAEAEPRR